MSESEIRTIIALFLQSWIQWVEQDAQEPHLIFSRNIGLCPSLVKFMRLTCRMDELSMVSVEGYFKQKLLKGDATPFNRGNQKNYSYEAHHEIIHKNQQRRMWAYQMLQELNKP